MQSEEVSRDLGHMWLDGSSWEGLLSGPGMC